MKSKLRVCCLQVSAGEDCDRNFSLIAKRLQTCLRKRPDVIALPENFLWRGGAKDLAFVSSRTPLFLKSFRAFSEKHRVYLLLGSLLESAPGGKVYNTSFLIAPSGRVIAKYRKIHLFDAALKDVRVRESKYVKPGIKAVTGLIEGVKAGLSICYDLRFPELFRKYSQTGCRLLFIPSNFTQRTGRAHWEVLLRARAIENLSFVIAPAQTGINPDNGIKSYGNSMIVDPWGRVLAKGGDASEEEVWADLDLASQMKTRKVFPVLAHRHL